MAKRLNVICGPYGSGKTEFAINYALSIKASAPSSPIAVVDLDIVNPYFRSRDVATSLSEQGLEVVSTGAGLEQADLPALSPRIYAFLQDTTYRVVFDVGGDPVGARALGRFNNYFLNEDYDLLLVVNPYRPDAGSLAALTGLVAGIETTSRLRVSALVSNINLGPETTIDLWRDGLELVQQLSKELAIPIKYHAVEAGFLKVNQAAFQGAPVFAMQLRMLPPWLQV